MMKDIGCSNSYMIVGVSGGPDSMALLDLLSRIGMKVVIAHVNYQKRPTADRDEKIVKDYAKRYGIPYFVTRPTYHKDNFQAWAREVRYSFYKEIADIFSTRSIFLAHNLDDYIETLMMQMKRGSFHKHYGIGKSSLHDDYQIFRPLIIYPKSLLETYCQKNAIAYGIDETNLEDDYTRNYLRHHELKGLTLKAKLGIYKVSEDIGKRRAEQSGMVAVKWVLIEFYNAADGVTESFRRDGAPVGATAANILITLDNCDARTLLNQAHCSAFAAGAGTYYYGIVIVGMWHGRAYLFLYIKATEW